MFQGFAGPLYQVRKGLALPDDGVLHGPKRHISCGVLVFNYFSEFVSPGYDT